MAIVIFDAAAFRAKFPDFAAVTDPQLQACFDEACLSLNNTDGSPVQDVAQRAILLDLATAHIAFIQYVQQAGVLVGRVNQAAEGSQSASAEMAAPSMRSAPWQQTKYGVRFWAATKQFRAFIHLPGQSRAQIWPR